MSLRLIYLIFVRIAGWLVLLGRSSASKDVELLSVWEGTLRSNKFASGCAFCSVLVLEGGGFLSRDDQGWVVVCGTCQQIQMLAEPDVDPDDLPLPSKPPLGCARSIKLRVLGLTHSCWKCSRDTVCVVGLYPERPSRSYVGLHTTESEFTMAVAQRLLRQQGHAALASSIQPRYSKTAGERYLSNGCQRCNALQGNFLLGEEALNRVANGGLAGLETLTIADCPTLDWQCIVHEVGAVIGI